MEGRPQGGVNWATCYGRLKVVLSILNVFGATNCGVAFPFRGVTSD